MLGTKRISLSEDKHELKMIKSFQNNQTYVTLGKQEK